MLRTHLQLADDVGVVVDDVVPDSPAEKAGLRKHDVLIEVDGEQITDMTVLQKAVAASDGKPVELKLIRLAKEMTMAVTPEERPADLAGRRAAIRATATCRWASCRTCSGNCSRTASAAACGCSAPA